MPRLLCSAAALLLLLALAAWDARAQSTAGVNEHGAFTLFKFARAIGHESYSSTHTPGGGYAFQDDFLFTDRGTPVALKTTATLDDQLSPTRFTTEGQSSRSSSLSDVVELAGDRARVTRDGKLSESAVPPVRFVIDGYSPVAMQELLVQYWSRHGRPSSLAVLPTGTVTIRPAGDLLVAGKDGRQESLAGYTISGLIWGQDSLWMDAQGRLIALVSTDAEFDHFEALREGYEQALPTFIAAAAKSNLSALASLAGEARRAAPKVLAITGATLLDGRGGPALPNSVVLVTEGRIAAVGSSRTVDIPHDAKVLDARGKWLMAGLWDMHAHYEQVEWGPIYLASGITAVRDCGNEFDFITTVRDAIDHDAGIGPRILMAGIVDGPSKVTLGAITADTPEQAKAVVARYRAAGALQIKLYSSIKPELVPVFAAEAHRLGMTVTGHVPNGMTATEAVDAGMDQINHISYLVGQYADLKKHGLPPADLRIDFNSQRSRAITAELVEHHTVIDPTVALYELQFHPETAAVASFEPGVDKVAPPLRYQLAAGGVPAKIAPNLQALLHAMLDTVGALHRAGVPVVAGTDQAVPGYSLHRELELYVQAGMTPMEAIQSATIVPARAMGLERESGSVEVGKRGDLLLLDADPLADIRATRRVWRTVQGGAVYDPTPLWRSVAFTP